MYKAFKQGGHFTSTQSFKGWILWHLFFFYCRFSMWYGIHLAKKRASKHNYCIERGARESRRKNGVHMGLWFRYFSKWNEEIPGCTTICMVVQLLSFRLWEDSSLSVSPNICLTDSLRPIQLMKSPGNFTSPPCQYHDGFPLWYAILVKSSLSYLADLSHMVLENAFKEPVFPLHLFVVQTVLSLLNPQTEVL